MTQTNNEQVDEPMTLDDVLEKIKLIQEMKLLFLQGVTLHDEGRDICIHHIVNEKTLIKIIEKYRHHYDDVMKYHNTITIYNLHKLSFLRVGLQKEVLRFMENYFSTEPSHPLPSSSF